MNYNKVMFGGRIANDLELKSTTTGNTVLTFALAVARIHKDRNSTTDFFDCIAWSKAAELIAKYFKKGSTIFVEGEMQTRSYTDREGKKRKAVEMVVEKFEFVDKVGAELQAPDVAADEGKINQQPEYIDSDDLPF